jgi:hypothetical protein
MLEGLRSLFRNRYYLYEFRTSSVPTLSASTLLSDFFFFFIFVSAAGLIVYYGIFAPTPETSSSVPVTQTVTSESPKAAARAAPKVIVFGSDISHARVESPVVDESSALSSRGSIVSVRLLNAVEVYDSAVPALAQITDYGLGKKFFGKTLVGDATPMASVGRMRIDFNTLRVNSRNSIFLVGQALSTDGSFGLIAQKKQGIIDRGVLGGVRNSLNEPLYSRSRGFGRNFSMESMLLGALVRGVQDEFHSDVSVDYERSVVLTLKPGKSFVVQLLDDMKKEK